MTRLYFDITDIVYFAARYSRVTGIQRVQWNIINLLARKHGGEIVRCSFFHQAKRTTVEFDPSRREGNEEFDADGFLQDIGMAKSSSRFPSRAKVKSYLRSYNNRKWLRTLKKIEVYVAALLWPGHLQKLGLAVESGKSRPSSMPTSTLAQLPEGSCYVCMGSTWLHPEVWAFAQTHRDRGGDVVQMVYDLIPMLHPEYYAPKEPLAYKAWLDASFHYASRFMCISEWTARDLREYAKSCDVDPQIKVVPLAHEFPGYDRVSRLEPTPQVTKLAQTPFVLCVGTIEHRKNGVMLLKAWRDLVAEHPSDMPMLVFAGKYGKGSDQFQSLLADDKALEGQVLVINSPSDRELAWLYQNCLFTVFPSTYEGWGLPVGEAAWFGKYCVASNATSIPEVCGELIDYVDPHSFGSIKAGIKRPLMDQEYLFRREAAISIASMRTWSDVADDIFHFSLRNSTASARRQDS